MMNGRNGYAVFLYPQALEALGDAIKPYLQDSPAGPHVQCHEIDTAGALVELTLHGRNDEGVDVVLELMIPSGMVRMIVSTQSDGSFGFGPRVAAAAPTTSAPTQAPASASASAQPPVPSLPVIGPAAPAPEAPAHGLPSSDEAGVVLPGDADADAASPGASAAPSPVAAAAPPPRPAG